MVFFIIKQVVCLLSITRVVGGLMKGIKRKILILDPDTKMREEYASLFSNVDSLVITRSGITKAIEKIRKVPFDCIIMDVDLPEMKGYEAVKIVRNFNPKVKVIITSTSNSRELESKVREQDIFYYHIKSFENQELILAVDNVFKKIGKEREGNKMNRPAKILIVDDDPDFVNATRIILEKKDYKVDVAHNRNEAMDKIQEVKPDLILLDIMMDRLDDGFTICYKLKHDPDLKKIPVFTISSITEKTGFKFNPKTDGEYFEADDYAVKPIEATDLLQRIEALLNE